MISDDSSVLLCLPIIIGYREIMLQVGNFCQQRVLQLHKPVEMISASFIQSHSVTSSYASSLADHSRYRDTLGHDSWAIEAGETSVFISYFSCIIFLIGFTFIAHMESTVFYWWCAYLLHTADASAFILCVSNKHFTFNQLTGCYTFDFSTLTDDERDIAWAR